MALEKALTFILFLVVGFLIRRKFSNKEQVNGIKNMILTIALPATIFIALMGAEIEPTMLVYPALALVFNVVLYALTPLLLKLFGISKESEKGRTLTLLLPSLAPGLSCFPFILEFIGENELAIAALADVGNKIFVLIFLYLIAMNMYLRLHSDGVKNKRSTKVKSLLLAMIKEPINMVMVVAFVLLLFGFQFNSLPSFLSNTLARMSAMMTPLVLLFIGLAVKVKKKSLVPILGLLSCRAGVSMLLSTAIVILFGIDQPGMVLLALVFPLSSASFWPFAHMAAFQIKESNEETTAPKTFDLDYAVLVLACSLPFSTLLILGILSSGETFVNSLLMLSVGLSLIGLGLLPSLVKRIRTSSKFRFNPKLPEPLIKAVD